MEQYYTYFLDSGEAIIHPINALWCKRTYPSLTEQRKAGIYLNLGSLKRKLTKMGLKLNLSNVDN